VLARLRVTQTKSTISQIARNRATIRALGLHRIGDTVEVPDNPATRGMVRQVRFMVSVEEIPAEGAAARAPKTKPSAKKATTEESEESAEAPSGEDA